MEQPKEIPIESCLHEQLVPSGSIRVLSGGEAITALQLKAWVHSITYDGTLLLEYTE